MQNKDKFIADLVQIFYSVCSASARFYFGDSSCALYDAEYEYCGLIATVGKVIETHGEQLNIECILKFLMHVVVVLSPFDSDLTVILRQRLVEYLEKLDNTELVSSLLTDLVYIGDERAIDQLAELNILVGEHVFDNAQMSFVEHTFAAVIAWYEPKLSRLIQNVDEKFLLLGMVDYSMMSKERLDLLVRNLLLFSNALRDVEKIWEKLDGQMFLWSIRSVLRQPLHIFCCYEYLRKSMHLPVVCCHLQQFIKYHVEFVPACTLLGGSVSLERFSAQDLGRVYEEFAQDLRDIDVQAQLLVSDDRFIGVWCIEYFLLAVKAYRQALLYYRQAESGQDVKRIEIELIQLCRYIKQQNSGPEIIRQLLALLQDVILTDDELSLLYLACYDISDTKLLLPPLPCDKNYFFYQCRALIVLEYINLLDGTIKSSYYSPISDMKRVTDCYLLLLQPDIIFPKHFMVVIDEDEGLVMDGAGDDELDEGVDNNSLYSKFVAPIFDRILKVANDFSSRFNISAFWDQNYPIARLVYYYLEKRIASKDWDIFKEVLFCQATDMFLERRKDALVSVTDSSYALARLAIAKYYGKNEKFGVNEVLARYWDNLVSESSIANHQALAEYYVENAQTIECAHADRIAYKLMQWILHPESPIASDVVEYDRVAAINVVARIYVNAEKKTSNASQHGYLYKNDDGRSDAVVALFQLALQRINVGLVQDAWSLLSQLFNSEKKFLEQQFKKPSEEDYPVRLVRLQKHLKSKCVKMVDYCSLLDGLIGVCNLFRDQPIEEDILTYAAFVNLQKLCDYCDQMSVAYDFSNVKKLAWHLLQLSIAEDIPIESIEIMANSVRVFLRNSGVACKKFEQEPEVLYALFSISAKIGGFDEAVYRVVRTRLLDSIADFKAPVIMRQRAAEQLARMYGDDSALYMQERNDGLVRIFQQISGNNQHASFPFVLQDYFDRQGEDAVYSARFSGLLLQLFDITINRIERSFLTNLTEFPEHFLGDIRKLISYYEIVSDAYVLKNSDLARAQVLEKLQKFEENTSSLDGHRAFIEYLRSCKGRYLQVDSEGYVGEGQVDKDKRLVGKVDTIIFNRLLAMLLLDSNISVSFVQVAEFNLVARKGACWSLEDLLRLLEIPFAGHNKVVARAKLNLENINKRNMRIGSIFALSFYDSSAKSLYSKLSGLLGVECERFMMAVVNVVTKMAVLTECSAAFTYAQELRKQAAELLIALDSNPYACLVKNAYMDDGVNTELLYFYLARFAVFEALSIHKDGEQPKTKNGVMQLGKCLRSEVKKYIESRRNGEIVSKMVMIFDLRLYDKRLREELTRLDNFYHRHTNISELIVGENVLMTENLDPKLYFAISLQFDFNWHGVLKITVCAKKRSVTLFNAGKDLYFYLVIRKDGSKQLIIPFSNSRSGSLSKVDHRLLEYAAKQTVLLHAGKVGFSVSSLTDKNQFFVRQAQAYLEDRSAVFRNNLGSEAVRGDVASP
ncbi:MAG: hypothetical protein KAS93_03390 [Gammaproteobacteria bacterium]|nr:hypothetical protein [Gammaproteobacteria bacterium]